MHMSLPVVAVDFGASSVRVCLVDLDQRPLEAEVLHRAPHAPQRWSDGSLRWDWHRLVGHAVTGIEAARARGPVASIAFDTWGVDYGLLDAGGTLLSPPHAYRDPRTAAWRAVADRIGPERLYHLTGIQLLAINTLFQLAAHDAEELARAKRLLMLPELLAHALGGAVIGEITSTSTTGMIDLATGGWSPEIGEAIGIDAALLPDRLPATTPAGFWHGVPLHLVGGHDTASAVAAMGAAPDPDAVFISSGTWMLVGRELAHPLTTPAAREANFSNEAGAVGGVRFLRNLAGMWLLEQCRAQWGDPPLDELLSAARDAGDNGARFDPTGDRFTDPGDMEAEVRTASGLGTKASRGDLVRTIVESLAEAAAAVIADIDHITGRSSSEIHILGGGNQNALLNERIAAASGLPVHLGPTEATSLGNALVQGIALGRFHDLAEARAALGPS